MDRELLIELGLEELPASWLPPLTQHMSDTLRAALKAHGLPATEAIEVHGTPRRLRECVSKPPRDLEAVVEKLRYRPLPSARVLAGRRSYLVAMLFDNPSSNYLMEIELGVLDACQAQHYNLCLLYTSPSPRD